MCYRLPAGSGRAGMVVVVALVRVCRFSSGCVAGGQSVVVWSCRLWGDQIFGCLSRCTRCWWFQICWSGMVAPSTWCSLSGLGRPPSVWPSGCCAGSGTPGVRGDGLPVEVLVVSGSVGFFGSGFGSWHGSCCCSLSPGRSLLTPVFSPGSSGLVVPACCLSPGIAWWHVVDIGHRRASTLRGNGRKRAPDLPGTRWGLPGIGLRICRHAADFAWQRWLSCFPGSDVVGFVLRLGGNAVSTRCRCGGNAVSTRWKSG